MQRRAIIDHDRNDEGGLGSTNLVSARTTPLSIPFERQRSGGILASVNTKAESSNGELLSSERVSICAASPRDGVRKENAETRFDKRDGEKLAGEHEKDLRDTPQGRKRKLKTAPKPKRAQRAKKPKDMPRRPLSAYNIFFKEERTRLMERTAGEAATEDKDNLPHGKIGFEVLAKTIGKRWKELTPKRMQNFKSLALSDMDRYKAEMDVYHQSLAHKRERAAQPELPDSPMANEGPAPSLDDKKRAAQRRTSKPREPFVLPGGDVGRASALYLEPTEDVAAQSAAAHDISRASHASEKQEKQNASSTIPTVAEITAAQVLLSQSRNHNFSRLNSLASSLGVHGAPYPSYPGRDLQDHLLSGSQEVYHSFPQILDQSAGTTPMSYLHLLMLRRQVGSDLLLGSQFASSSSNRQLAADSFNPPGLGFFTQPLQNARRNPQGEEKMGDYNAYLSHLAAQSTRQLLHRSPDLTIAYALAEAASAEHARGSSTGNPPREQVDEQAGNQQHTGDGHGLPPDFDWGQSRRRW
jgi:hypothetical protein